MELGKGRRELVQRGPDRGYSNDKSGSRRLLDKHANWLNSERQQYVAGNNHLSLVHKTDSTDYAGKGVVDYYLQTGEVVPGIEDDFLRHHYLMNDTGWTSEYQNALIVGNVFDDGSNYVADPTEENVAAYLNDWLSQGYKAAIVLTDSNRPFHRMVNDE